MTEVERHAGIVLCGGLSSRMGRPKAMLPFGNETLLQRVVRLLQPIVSPLVVVAAREQPLPPLPPDVVVTHDEQERLGPLEGIRAGLSALPVGIAAAYITSCDAPFLSPDFVRCLIGLLPGHDVVVPVDGEFHHPLAAVYRPGVLPVVCELLAARRFRPVYLYEQVRTRRVPIEELRIADPELRTLINLNTPEDYAAAVTRIDTTFSTPYHSPLH